MDKTTTTGLIEFRSKDDGTPTEFIVAQQFANVANASTGSKDGKWTLQVMSNQTLTNRLIANSSGVGVTGNFGCNWKYDSFRYYYHN